MSYRSKADLSKPLQPVLRVVYCGLCKHVWRMKGHITIRGKGIIRVFKCPSCGKVAKRDYINEPSYHAIDTFEDREPLLYWANPDFKEYNNTLLEN